VNLSMELDMKKLHLFSLLCLVFVLSCQSIGMTTQAVATGTQSASPTMTLMPLQTATSTFTPTPIPPMLSVLTEVPCRAGPGDSYDLVTNLSVGEKVPVVGKMEAFWVVRPPTGEECWIPDEKVEFAGEISALPVMTPPLTPVPVPPAAPMQFTLLKRTCTIDHTVKPNMYVNEFQLGWGDASNNEDGFRIYRDGDLVAEVAANVTSVIDVVIRRNPRQYYYTVAAYNEAGETRGDTKVFHCGK
jgi:hypothetical protein